VGEDKSGKQKLAVLELSFGCDRHFAREMVREAGQGGGYLGGAQARGGGQWVPNYHGPAEQVYQRGGRTCPPRNGPTFLTHQEMDPKNFTHLKKRGGEKQKPNQEESVPENGGSASLGGRGATLGCTPNERGLLNGTGLKKKHATKEIVRSYRSSKGVLGQDLKAPNSASPRSKGAT